MICVQFLLWPLCLINFHPAFCVTSWVVPAVYLTSIMACIYCEMIQYRKRYEQLQSSCEVECISLKTYVLIFVVGEAVVSVMWFALRPAKIIFSQAKENWRQAAYVRNCTADSEWETLSVFVGPMLALIYVVRSLHVIIKKIGWSDLPDRKNRQLISWEVRLKLICVILLLALNVLLIPLMINASEIGLQCQRAKLVYIIWSELNAFIPLACLLLPDAYVILFSRQYDD